MEIHPTAIISKKARLEANVIVGAYSLIGDNVSIGENTVIGAHCVIDGFTSIGKMCQVFTGAVLGSRPQDLKYKGEKSFLEVGSNNIIREYCTFNPGTGEGGKTVVGSNNLFMAYSHVAHDCQVGNNCVIANNGTLAGHVIVEDMAVLGGLTGIHQFVRVGAFSIIGGLSKAIQDIPPYSICDGHPAVVYGLNLRGLRQHKIPEDSIKELGRAFKALFNSGLIRKHALERVEKEVSLTKEVSYLVDFVKNSKRGMAHSCFKARLSEN